MLCIKTLFDSHKFVVLWNCNLQDRGVVRPLRLSKTVANIKAFEVKVSLTET